MDPAQNQSLSLGTSEPNVTEVPPNASFTVSSLTLVLSLTFTAQLLLVVYVVWRCFSYDRRLRDKYTHMSSRNKLQSVSYISDEADAVIDGADSSRPRSHGTDSSTALLSPAMSESWSVHECQRSYYPWNSFMPGQAVTWDMLNC